MDKKIIQRLSLTVCALILILSSLSFAADSNSPKAAIGGKVKVKFVLIGDSTVSDRQGWGPGFKQFLKDDVYTVNTAIGGRSSKSFIAEGRLTKALAIKGEYYLIQFGHNDDNKDPNKADRATDPNTTYKQYMSQYIDEVRKIGAKPIIVTSMVRRQWDKTDPNKINSTVAPYAEAAKVLAKEKNVPVVDLYTSSKQLCEKLGKQGCFEFSPTKEGGAYDNTHLNEKGSTMFAQLVVEDLVKVAPELKPCFKDKP